MNNKTVIVVAPDKFKGSANAEEVAAALNKGLRSAISSAEVRCVPVADGGEGTVDAAVAAGFTRRTTRVTGPIGKPVDAAWALQTTPDGVQAVVELAQASGIELLEPSQRTGFTATSRGTGELLQAALDAGSSRIVLGLGGSACTDGGAGMLAALGAALLDTTGNQIPDGGGYLQDLSRIDLADLDQRWFQTEIVLASDVNNPLLGPQGAAAVFGPQKGLNRDDVLTFDTSLEHFAGLLSNAAEEAFGDDAKQHVSAATTQPGAGAAGGTGFAAMAVFQAQRRRGIDLVLEIVRFTEALAAADLVITGEGSLDAQTLQGKAPAGIAELAGHYSIPVYAVCGRNLLTAEETAQARINRVFALSELEPDPEVSMREAQQLLITIGAQIGDTLLAHPV